MTTGTPPSPSIVTVTKTIINSPATSIRPRTPGTVATNDALDTLDLNAMTAAQALTKLTQIKNDHDTNAARRELFGTARTARPGDVTLMRSCDSKPLPLMITPDDNGHSMMAGLNELLSRRLTFVT